ncbi:hypothetical protein GMB86_11250 [Terrilactibacillus sp. BCM23-1]|uniref:DUF3955 domain-containing protein n=1 Tax=Terrilactibacillus tamarindi TaxID=2599694 RepID=A0A6N8CU07_9BACI|nr:hypothetical protein [Terrilactibacillus tamarindi]MTT32583.1 hypothetical protein [Terrilactibacillus tamarindi]
MKIQYFFIASLLIGMGLMCMTYSANLFERGTIMTFGKTFFQIGMMVVCPVVLFICLYLVFHYKKKK